MSRTVDVIREHGNRMGLVVTTLKQGGEVLFVFQYPEGAGRTGALRFDAAEAFLEGYELGCHTLQQVREHFRSAMELLGLPSPTTKEATHDTGRDENSSV